LKQYL